MVAKDSAKKPTAQKEYVMPMSQNKVVRFFKALGHHFVEDNITTQASALAYTTLLSLVPLMIVMLYVLSLFPFFDGVGKTVQQFAIDNLVASSSDVISKYLNEFLSQISSLSWRTILGLFVVSMLTLYNMVRTSNRIWKVNLSHNVVLHFLIYMVVLFLGPIVVAVMLVVSSYVTSLPAFSGNIATHWLKSPLLFVLPYVFSFIAFTLLNWLIPSTKVPFRFACVAGFITMVLFEIAKWLFAWYISLIPTYRLLYGALATIPIFFVWVYFSWIIVLIGIEICRILTLHHEKKSTSSDVYLSS